MRPKKMPAQLQASVKRSAKYPCQIKQFPWGALPYGAAEQGMVFRVFVVNRVYNFTFEPLEQGVFLDLKP